MADIVTMNPRIVSVIAIHSAIIHIPIFPSSSLQSLVPSAAVTLFGVTAHHFAEIRQRFFGLTKVAVERGRTLAERGIVLCIYMLAKWNGVR